MPQRFHPRECSCLYALTGQTDERTSVLVYRNRLPWEQGRLVMGYGRCSRGLEYLPPFSVISPFQVYAVKP